MSERAAALRRQLIRNFDEIPKERELRPPLYDTECARLGAGTAAVGLGMAIDILPPGMRGCPYHLHHAQEEAAAPDPEEVVLLREIRDALKKG